MTDTDRRQFLKTTATAAGTALAAAPAVARSPRSPNDTIRVGLLGMGGRMASHVAALLQMADENVEIVAICDCDQNQLGLALERYPELKDKKVKQYSDMREMFDDPSIDAVSNALGDRWHALSTIWACQAGKDSYVEKPGTHNMFEGRQMVAAARKYDCIVQHGTQNRSSPNIMQGIGKLKEGVIGDVYMARGLDYKLRGNFVHQDDRTSPTHVAITYKFGDEYPLVSYEHRSWYTNSEAGFRDKFPFVQPDYPVGTIF